MCWGFKRKGFHVSLHVAISVIVVGLCSARLFVPIYRASTRTFPEQQNMCLALFSGDNPCHVLVQVCRTSMDGVASVASPKRLVLFPPTFLCGEHGRIYVVYLS